MLNLNLNEIVEREIEERVAARVAQVIDQYRQRKDAPPEMPVDVTADGTVVKPFLIGGVKYVTRKDAAALLGLKLPALWMWTERKKVLEKKKLGHRIYYRYDDVVGLIDQEKGGAQ